LAIACYSYLLNNVQDFLCKILTEETAESRATIGALSGDIVCVKEKKNCNRKGVGADRGYPKCKKLEAQPLGRARILPLKLFENLLYNGEDD
jgi:hypothetical protein